jgi:hypothetical protein
MMNTTVSKRIALSAAAAMLFTSQTVVPIQSLAAEEPVLTASAAPILSASVTIADNGVDAVSRDILEKELEIIRTNTLFRNNYTKTDRSQQIRNSIYQIGATGLANAGDITLMSQFWRYNRNPGLGLQNRGRLEAGLIIVLAAYSAVVAAYSGEYIIDQVQDLQTRKRGLDSKTTLNRVIALNKELTALLVERQALVDKTTDANMKEFWTAEGKILEDCRNLTLADFSRLYVDYRKRHAVRDLTTLGTIAVGATGIPGTLLVLRGVQQTNLKKVGGGGIAFEVSAGILTVAPILFEGGGRIVSKSAHAKLANAFGQVEQNTINQLDIDANKLVALSRQPGVTVGQPLNERLQAYLVCKKLLESRQRKMDLEAAAARRKLMADIISYGIRGGTQLAWGALLMNAGYKYNDKPATAFRRVAQAATVNEVSWGSWLVEALATGANQQIASYKHSKNPDYDPFKTSGEKIDTIKASLK